MHKEIHKHHKDQMLECTSKKLKKCKNGSKYRYGHCTKLCVLSFALSVALVNGLFVLSMGWLAAFCEKDQSILQGLGPIYIAFEPSFLGGIYAGLFGALIGFIGGSALACIYNCCLCRCHKFRCKTKCKSVRNDQKDKVHHKHHSAIKKDRELPK